MRLETVEEKSPEEVLKRYGKDVQVSVLMSQPQPLRALIDRNSINSRDDDYRINESDMLISFLKKDFPFEIGVNNEISIDDEEFTVEKIDKSGTWLDLELLGRV